ncbi:helix-turn-helix domain-containing protein [Kibdelosporangium aridum]|uniref:Helix-turn-helix domain-containing protein n=1 Tax=Kibdelosporangium aridum TaxID=2030 RepID=A0A1W2FWU3_KIBAR|nr:helix-turn-helix transcriptional regulator [Kibdelosporangium aridum]SMD26212.1 Helix-turn-helix domain-containing protein [Kibdelosporangium aridum]
MIRVADEAERTSARRKRLANELRRLRDLAGLSGRDLAQRIGISQSKVSRIESGRSVPSMPEVDAWARVTNASDDRKEWLTAMTNAVFTEVQPWRATLADSHVQNEVHERERNARLIRTFQPSVVPGLLQTADYARYVYSLAQPYPDHEVATAIAGRMERQVALYEQDRRFEFLITEAALRWRPVPLHSHLAQLDRITAISTLENVSIGVIPLAQQVLAPAPHAFIVYSENDGDLDDFVEVETVHANLIVNDLDDVAIYQNQWSMLCRTAIFDDELRTFLAALITEFRHTAHT